MSILIKGMEMPTSCGECKFFAWKRGVGQHCAVDDRITFHATIDGMDVAYERSGACPLIPISDHGDLIDRKTALDSLMNGMVMTWYQSRAMDCVNEFYCPTIIEAEEGE